jgi:hypothetical protein
MIGCLTMVSKEEGKSKKGILFYCTALIPKSTTRCLVLVYYACSIARNSHRDRISQSKPNANKQAATGNKLAIFLCSTKFLLKQRRG